MVGARKREGDDQELIGEDMREGDVDKGNEVVLDDK